MERWQKKSPGYVRAYYQRNKEKLLEYGLRYREAKRAEQVLNTA